MNINQLRTPEGLNKYLNEVVKDLPVKLPDFMLKPLLWQKVKFDFLISNDPIENLHEDNNLQLLVIKSNEVATKLLIGYLHISDDLNINSADVLNSIAQKTNESVNALNDLIAKNKWADCQIFIISTFKLSNYKKLDLSLLPNYVKYLSLSEFADAKKKYYEVALDNETNKFMEGDLMLKALLKEGENFNL